MRVITCVVCDYAQQPQDAKAGPAGLPQSKGYGEQTDARQNVQHIHHGLEEGGIAQYLCHQGGSY